MAGRPEGGAISAAKLIRGLRFAFNERHSMSGYLALARDLAKSGIIAEEDAFPAFWSAMVETHAHRASVLAVAEGGADVWFSAPDADFLGAHDPERFEKLRAEIANDSSAWSLAALYETHAVIDPRDTRTTLCRLLDVHCGENGTVGLHRLANWPTSY